MTYQTVLAGDKCLLVGIGQQAVVTGIEQVRFNDSTVSWNTLTAQPAAFDALRYVASNPDLVSSIGTNVVAAETHYIQQGLAEGRSTMSFDPLRYLASNKDLALGFGANTTAAETHYIEHGLAEGRSATSFDALQYLAANTDLASGFGYDVQGAERHYVEHGVAEGRATTGFDAIAYLLTYPDLAMAKLGPTWATEHWVLNGADEGRIGDGLFGREQPSHAGVTGAYMIESHFI